jgi:hypothetical protein
MSACAISVDDKRSLAKRVGKDLKSNFGRKNFYHSYEVTAAMRRLGYDRSWDCWALSLYVSPYDFDVYYKVRGETCDYVAMHAAMLSSIEHEGLSTKGTGITYKPDRRLPDDYAGDGLWSVLDLFDYWDW